MEQSKSEQEHVGMVQLHSSLSAFDEIRFFVLSCGTFSSSVLFWSGVICGSLVLICWSEMAGDEDLRRDGLGATAGLGLLRVDGEG